MKKFTSLLKALALVAFIQLTIQAQTTGSIAGTVVDQNGAVIPNATVVVRGESGQEFTVTTTDNGTYRIPGVAAGLYRVTITSTGFKQSITNNVKVDIGLPTTVDAGLEVGGGEQVVEVTSGGEVIQTQTATVGTTITGRQITETPIASRDALDLVLLLPGTASVGAPRRSSVNGLPKSALSITLDGADVQEQENRNGEGYFAFVRPRVDAVEEVSISTANLGAESSGDGAVQIRFVTRRGTNRYTGSLYDQIRNEAFNAAYWYNNRDLAPLPGKKKAPRDKIKLNQPGFRVGGPIPFPHFGEGGPLFHSGKDRAFFFVNYEQFRLPQSITRNRTILTPDAQAGIFRYIVGNETRTVNLFDIARNRGLVATPDPTVSAVLNTIRASTASTGTIRPILSNTGVVTDPNRQTFGFQNDASGQRRFLALRFDVNLNKNNSVEFVMNRQNFLPSVDVINGTDAPFPGGSSYGQGGIRKSYTGAVRSTITQNIVNEARYAVVRGGTDFRSAVADSNDFDITGGLQLNIGGAAGITNLRSTTGYTISSSPTSDFTDSLTWIKGNHSFTFGGQYKTIKGISTGRTIVPTVGFGIASTEADFAAFSSGAAGTLPGASDVQATEARNLYATLVGRISSFGTTAVLTDDGTYQVQGEQTRSNKQVTAGLFAQDSWRVNPNLTISYGLRWQPQFGATVTSANYSRLENNDQVYGVSGLGNLFTPGTMTGTAPRTVGLEVGEKIFPDDLNNFAPSVGVVWSPNFGEGGLLRRVFGESGRSVFRGGYSQAFIREGSGLIGSIVGANPGGSLAASRTIAANTLTGGTLLRTPGNPNLTPLPFTATPQYPFALGLSDGTNAFSPDLKTGVVHSFSFGYQRELDKNTVIEIRYVGNRGIDLVRQTNLNQVNTIENGVLAEFQLAQQNLYANIAANRCQAGVTVANCQYNIAYFGPGTGTNPLPITLAYLAGNITSSVATGSIVNRAALTAGAVGSVGSVTSTGAAIPSNYSSALFRSTTFTNPLRRNSASVTGFAAVLDNSNATQRQNALNAGLPANFLYINPTTPGGSYLVGNGTQTWYDSGVIELRRRLSYGLRVQASYVWSKALSNYFAANSDVFSNLSLREEAEDLAKTVQPYDIRHNFKFDATYDLPFGRGRTFFSDSGRFVNALVGGFSILPTIRWQSGSPIQLGNAQLVGMTVEELQKEIKVRKNATTVTWLPDDIIQNSIAAFNPNLTSSTGYSAQFGVPTGRFIAPAGFGNCLQAYAGQCGFNNLVLYGPSFFKFDAGITKRFNFDEKRNFEIHVNILDVLNAPNFRVGGFGADIVTTGCCGATFGQLGSGSAYRDLNTTNDPGGRVIDFLLRFNF